MKFDKDITKIKRVTFFETQCRLEVSTDTAGRAQGAFEGHRLGFKVRVSG